MRREQGLIKRGLKSLGYLKFKERVSQDTYIFQCIKCGIDLERLRITNHFTTYHKEIYYQLKTLIHAWGLVGNEDTPEPEAIDTVPF